MLRRLLAFAAIAVLAHTARSQGCTAGQIFLKNDNLPDVPGTATVSIIPGLCEGEAMGCVFDVSNQQTFSNEVKVNMVAGAYINPANAQGVLAIVNLKIHDGVSWAGSVPTLGPMVFDFENDAGANIQFSSSGINTVDISNFNVVVTSGKLVVIWEMLDNFSSGSCSQGYTTNFATDNVQPACSGSCSPTQRNIIFIQGLGYRDPMTATISGIPLCSCYYAGNWIIRACVSAIGYPQAYCTGKLNSANCVAQVGWSGTATLTGLDNFHVTCSSVVNNKQGLMFWGTTAAALPFFNGFLCVAQPVSRTGIQNSLGSTGCTGTYDFHFTHAYMTANGMQAGDVRRAQFWYRDPQQLDGTTVATSNAVAFKVLP